MKKLIKHRLEDVFEAWSDGLGYLIGDELNSYYTFFTVILAECAYLWAFYEKEIAMPFTVILFGYALNVIIGAVLKSWFEGSKIEVKCAAILIASTALAITIRTFQLTAFVEFFPEIVRFISGLFTNKFFGYFLNS